MKTTTDTAGKTVAGERGECQCCERVLGVKKGVMGHHGYKRPGHGHDLGECYGKGHVPYSQGHDALDAYLVALNRALATSQAYLADLQARTVTSFVVDATWKMSRHEIYRVAVGVTDMSELELRYSNETFYTKKRVDYLQSEVARVSKRIAAWVAPA